MSSYGGPDPKSKGNLFDKPTMKRARALGLYMTAAGIAVVGVSYASVPLYRLFCSVTGYGGTTQAGTVPW